jgi:predicted DCC family thiol-disulfide oxidoreductase YuxK
MSDNRSILRPPPPFLGPRDKLIVFDGVCKFCHFWSRFIFSFDHSRSNQLATIQSPGGIALNEHYHLPSREIESVYYYAEGKLFEKSSAVLKIIQHLPWPWRPLLIFTLIPAPIRDFLYKLIAQNRYRLFGRYSHCPLPTAEQQARYFMLTEK